MSFLIPGIAAGASALTNLISQSVSNNDQEDILKLFRDKMKDLLITDTEKENMNQSLRRTTNTSVQNANNQIGIAGANKANKGTFSAALLGPVLAEQNKGLYDLEQSIFQNNQQIEGKIAESYLSEPGSINIGETLATGLGGFQAGMSIDNYVNAEDNFASRMKLLNKMFG